MVQLEVKDLSLGYDGVILKDNLNFKIEKGDYVCILGENGSGKSTLMKTILGLKKPVSGQVIFADNSGVTSIGYLPQQTDMQRDFPASVREIVLSGFRAKSGLRPFYTKEEKTTAIKAMEKTNITNLSNRCYRELSGGQQQRVLLARAVCAADDIIFLDEPVTGLDPDATEEMYKLIKDLNEKDGMTVIMISHDMDSSLRYANKILNFGNEVFFGTKDEFVATREAK